MSIIRIMHISDIHWHPGNAKEIGVVRDALMADVKAIVQDGCSIDLILCTGDIVLAGEKAEHFSLAYEDILAPIIDCCGLTANEIFFCPGNHDISRESVRGSGFIERGLAAELNSVSNVNAVVDQVTSEHANSIHVLARMSNYEKFITALSQTNTARHPFVTTYHRKIRGRVIGISAFNNSWRASGESGNIDRHRLVMGERSLDIATDHLSSPDLRIAIFHHPLSWLTDFDRASVGPRLQRSYDLLAFGHVHESAPEMKVTPAGTSVSSQSGSLYAGREYFNGYQIIDIDPEVALVNLRARAFFNSPMARFGAAEQLGDRGHFALNYVSSHNEASVELEKYLRDARAHVREAALNQFNIADLGAEICSDPHTAFICPPLYRQRASDVSSNGDGAEQRLAISQPERPAEVGIDEILRAKENYIIEGSRETGKTSLAHFIAVKIAEGTSDKTRIPVVADYRSLKLNNYGLLTALSSYLKIPRSGYDFERGMAGGELVFIIDNFDRSDNKKSSELAALLGKYPNCRWILLADSRLDARAINQSEFDATGFERVYLRTLPRHSIRELTTRWCDRTGADREDTYLAVMAQIKDGDLPRTGYIVTLLLWALKQNKAMERINESVLLMNVVDYLIGKADFTKALDTEFDATAKEYVLQELAWHLKPRDGSIDTNDCLHFFINFFKSKGLPYDASSVVGSFCECGILVKQDGFISFKYRCFQDYFVAKRIASSEKVLKTALDNRSYLDYLREIDLASGLARENEFIVDHLAFQITRYKPSDLPEYNEGSFANIIESSSGIGITKKQLEKIRKTRLTARQIDDFMDSAEAALAKKRSGRATEGKKDPGETDSSVKNRTSDNGGVPDTDTHSGSVSLYDEPLHPLHYIQTTNLLGRVLRNSEFLDKKKKVHGVKVFMDANVNAFFKLNDLVSEMIDQIDLPDSPEERKFAADFRVALKYFLATRVMDLIADRIKDAIQSQKLVPIFDSIIAEKSQSSPEDVFFAALQLDASNPRWDEIWKAMASRSSKKRLVIKFLSDRLWAYTYDRVQNDHTRAKIVGVATDLELALSDHTDHQKAMKGLIAQGVRKAVDDAIKKSDD